MSELKLGYTIGYIGPKKVEFPPLMNNVVNDVCKRSLKKLLEEAEKKGNVVTIEAKEGVKSEKEVVKKGKEDLGVEPR